MTLLLIQAVATLMLTGLIWTIQVVHYPLMDDVGEPTFVAYHRRHAQRITWLVAPLMPAELGAALLIALAPPVGVPAPWAWTGLGLVVAVWVATAAWSVPAHARLSTGFDAAAHRRLVRTNVIRTALWSARAALVVALLVWHVA